VIERMGKEPLDTSRRSRIDDRMRSVEDFALLDRLSVFESIETHNFLQFA
jgi:hypothetical protein